MKYITRKKLEGYVAILNNLINKRGIDKQLEVKKVNGLFVLYLHYKGICLRCLIAGKKKEIYFYVRAQMSYLTYIDN